MDKSITIYNHEIPVTLYPATVIHTNKFSEAWGGAFDFPVMSTLYTDVVYRLKDSEKDHKVYIRNLDLPIYNSQEVILVGTDSGVIGFIDSSTNEYYYTVKDFSKKLGIGFPFYWFLIAGILGSFLVYYMQGQNFSGFTLLPVPGFLLLFRIQKRILNYSIQKSFDTYLQMPS